MFYITRRVASHDELSIGECKPQPRYRDRDQRDEPEHQNALVSEQPTGFEVDRWSVHAFVFRFSLFPYARNRVTS